MAPEMSIQSSDYGGHYKKEGKKNKVSGRLPLVAQVDFAYLFKLATGVLELPGDKVRRREVLRTLKGAVKGALQETAAA